MIDKSEKGCEDNNGMLGVIRVFVVFLYIWVRNSEDKADRKGRNREIKNRNVEGEQNSVRNLQRKIEF